MATDVPMPQGSGNRLRKIILGFVLVAIAIGILALIFTFLTPSKAPRLPKKATISQEQSLTGLEVAKKTALFLDKASRPDGDFEPFYSCQQSIQSCIPVKADPSNPEELNFRNGYIALAYLDLYKKTNDSSYKEKADKAMAFILKGCDRNVNYCYQSYKTLYQFYKDTNDETYKEAMLSASSMLLAGKSLNDRVWRNEGYRFWMLYDVTKDVKYKTALISYTDALLRNEVDLSDKRYIFSAPFYKEGDFEVREYMIWVAGNWYVPAYLATSEPKYLLAAQDFFDKANIAAHVEDFKAKKEGPDVNALDYLLDVMEVSAEPKKAAYKMQATTFAQAILLGYWDNSENKKFAGDYGFLFWYSQNPNNKFTSHSGWRVSQFLKLSDQQFSIR